MERKLQEVHPLLTLCGQIVETWQGNPIQKESLRVFFLVLQVTHYLDAGQVSVIHTAQTFLSDANRVDFELDFIEKRTEIRCLSEQKTIKPGLFEPANQF